MHVCVCVRACFWFSGFAYFKKVKEKPDQQAKLYNQNEQRVSVSVQARGSVDEFRNQHFLKATSQKTS